MGDPDLSSGSDGPGRGSGGLRGRGCPERPRGLVVLPAVGGVAPGGAEEGQRSFLRRWSVLVATLVVGVIAIVLIAALWSSPPAAPNPRSLPPPAASR